MAITTTSSGDSKEKLKLLQERREKLAKWKQARLSKAQQQSNERSTNPVSQEQDDQEQKRLERLSKLEAWKQKKKKKKEEEEEEESKKQQDKADLRPPSRRTKKPRVVFEDEAAVDPVVPKPKPSKNEQSNVIDSLEQFLDGLDDGNPMPSTERQGIIDNEDVVTESDGSDSDSNGFSSSRYRRITKLKAHKQVKEVDYKSQPLKEFQRDFYIPPEEVKHMTANEVKELRLSLDNIKVKGSGCPAPLTKWTHLGLSTSTMNLIVKRFNYAYPTPIQSQAIPCLMNGRDVIGISKTGSGKTIAYILPLLRHVRAQLPLSKNDARPIALVLVPTRELALQIHQEIVNFIADEPHLHCICCTGGSDLKTQINELKKGVEVVVATPGRFIDILTLNSNSLMSTTGITFVIMDEADRLFDMGFEPQVKQILKTIRPDKQCALFSATFPQKLRHFAMNILNDPLSITINSESLVNENVEQSFQICSSDGDKFEKLLYILEKWDQDLQQHAKPSDDKETDDKVIIFVSSQQICDLIYAKLETYDYPIFAIHAGKPYQERLSNLEHFKETKNSILLCTEVLSRGLNVPEVSLVIIYNSIKTFAQYVHTTGRTARGTRQGKAMTLLLDDEIASAYILRKSMREKELMLHSKQQLEKLTTMVEEFEAGIKSGKLKLTNGFGGKGLDNLTSKRKEKKEQEKLQYVGDTGVNDGASSNKATDIKETTSEESLDIPKLVFDTVKNVNSDGSITFSAHVYVNDLPQLVRWEVTKNSTLMFVKHETGCSITSRGKYYPIGSGPKSEKDEPKLYMLIEAQEEKDIMLCVDLLNEKVREGLKKVEYQSIKSTKY